MVHYVDPFPFPEQFHTVYNGLLLLETIAFFIKAILFIFIIKINQVYFELKNERMTVILIRVQIPAFFSLENY